MYNFVDALARGWLKRRGYFVPDRRFVGMVIGYSTAIEEEPMGGDIYRHFRVDIPYRGEIVALNNSLVDLVGAYPLSREE